MNMNRTETPAARHVSLLSTLAVTFCTDKLADLQDDVIGEAFQLCQTDFASQQGLLEVTQTDAFSAVFGCQQCVPPAPAPPTAAPVPQAPAQQPVQPEQSRQVTQDHMWGGALLCVPDNAPLPSGLAAM